MEPTQENKTVEVSSVSTTTAPAQGTAIGETQSVVIQSTPFYKNKQLIISIIIALAILGGAGYFVYTQYYKDGGVVASVNGKHIYRKELDENVSLMEQAAVAQGVDLTEEVAKTEIRNQALDVLVNNALLISGAERAGFVVNMDKVQEQYDAVVASVGGAEELKTRMDAIGLTEEKLRANIANRILADQYIEAETDIESITITTEEIDGILKSVNSDGAPLPPMEELRPQIEAELRSQKQQQIVVDLIAKLKESAHITIRI